MKNYFDLENLVISYGWLRQVQETSFEAILKMCILFNVSFEGPILKMYFSRKQFGECIS